MCLFQNRFTLPLLCRGGFRQTVEIRKSVNDHAVLAQFSRQAQCFRDLSFFSLRPTARNLITNQLSRGSLVTATLPTGDPSSSAMKQPSRSNLAEDKRLLTSFSLWKTPNVLSKMFRRTSSSQTLSALTFASDKLSTRG